MTETVKDANANVIAVITKVDDKNASDAAAVGTWLVSVMMAGAKTPGFSSGEIIPPEDPGHTEWKMVQRFRSAEQAKTWQDSEVRRQLIAEFNQKNKGSNGAAPLVSEEIAHFDSTFSNVATAILTDVKPGMEESYFAWESKIQAAQAKFPGYKGSYLQPPASPSGQWATLLRFDRPESLEKWFASEERLALLKDAGQFVKSTKFQSMSNSFPGWFPVDKETGEGPPNWKTAMLVLLGLFPVVMLEMKFLSPLEGGMNSSLSSFINLVISIIATTWGTMPLFIKAFTWWLFPPKDDPEPTNAKGLMTMILLFALEVIVMWNLLPRH